MSAKEQWLSEFTEASQPVKNVAAILLGGAVAVLNKEIKLGTTRRDLRGEEQFLQWLNSNQYKEQLPEIEQKISVLKGKVDDLGFNPWAAAIGITAIGMFRFTTKPFLAEQAKKLQEKGKLQAAINLRSIDNFWLATQTFLLMNMVNTVFHGGSNNEVEKGLSVAGGIVFAGGVIHMLAEASKRRPRKS